MATCSAKSISCALGMLFALAMAATANAADLKVLSTVGVQTVVDELVPQFERMTGHKLAITFGVSNLMKQQIIAGENFDVAIMTSTVTDELIAHGKVLAATRTDLAHGGIGIAVRAGAHKPDIGSVEALKRALLDAKSIAYSKAGASGIYFANLLEQLGLAEAMRPKTKYGTSNVAQMVAEGEAELGVQLINELLAVSGVEVVGPLPAEIQNYVTLTAGVATQAREPALAAEFIRFLTAPAALPVIKAKGLTPGGV
jgi:molybdate transport system substrate-binding protein